MVSCDYVLRDYTCDNHYGSTKMTDYSDNTKKLARPQISGGASFCAGVL